MKQLRDWDPWPDTKDVLKLMATCELPSEEAVFQVSLMYSRTTLLTDTCVIRTVFFVPGKSSSIFYKYGHLLIHTTDTCSLPNEQILIET